MTLTPKQIDRALDHLRNEYPEPMSVADRDDYYDVLTHFRSGELLLALEKLAVDSRPSPDTLLRTVMEARPGHRPGRPDPAFVKHVIDQARRDLGVRDAV